MPKITMQDIADALDTSRISVWKVFHNQSGVSEELVRRVHMKAAELGYSRFTKATSTPGAKGASRTVSVIVSRPESSIFWMQIIHQMAKELALSGVNLMYTYLPTAYRKDYTLPESLLNGAVDGAVILNVYDANLLQLIAALSLPKVFLDTVPTMPAAKLNGDLVVLEGRSLTEKITTHILDAGCTNIGFIGDISYAQTNTDRFAGFCDALHKRGLPLNHANCRTGSIGLRTHYVEISAFLTNFPKMPDAFVCASDYLANFVMQYFHEHDISVPGDVLISGFDNNTEYANVANFITTVNVETASLGKRLARKILLRMDLPDAAFEVSYISGELLLRESTRT